MSELSFGIKTAPHNTTYPAMLKVWQAADANPVFEHAWLFDHMNPIHGDVDGPCYEGWTLLSNLAARTERIRVGLMVTGNTYRHPAVLAHMAATIDVMSNGRLNIGLGAGWNEYEHQSMGIPLYAPGERIRRLGEACQVIKKLLTESVTSFEGRYYQLQEARLAPKPIQQPHPPLVIGGSGEQLTLRIVAEHADFWNYQGRSVEEFIQKAEVLHRHCSDVGRDPDSLPLSVQMRVDYDDLKGTAALLQGYADAGATILIMNLRYPYPDDIVARLASEVIPQISVG